MKMPLLRKGITVFAIVLFSLPFLTAQSLFINEFMASNSNTIADEAGDFEDWIEIYNAGSTDINLAGYYISDDTNDILIWQIPASDASKTTVPAGGHLILWADKDTEDGENHVDVKLGGGGESVVLTAPDAITIIDQITFGPQTDDISFGRETDGANDFVFFTTASPGAMNVPSGPVTYTIDLIIPISSEDADGEEFSSGGVTLSSSDIEMVQDGSLEFTSAFRFSNIALPEDATVTNAYLQFYAEEVQTGLADINIFADAAANATPLLNASGNFTNRIPTNNTISWTPAPWPTVDANGVDQQSPDLSTLIQEVVGQAGWQAGNAIVILMDGSGTRTTYSYDKDPAKAAVLHLQA
ncbi:MAG: lamin tail domain-containing protein, partial [Saprospiraceae bacterium]